MKTFILSFLFCLALAAAEEQTQPQPPQDVLETQQKLIKAIFNKDVATFHSVCDDGMKKAISATQLAAVNENISNQITETQKFSYLGFYMKNDMEVYLFKAKETNSNNDVVMFLTIRFGKCAGLFFQ
jgi:hypothetical protein